MEIFRKKTNIDFMAQRWFAIIISLLLALGSFYLWFSKGDEKFGIDFRGGHEFVVRFKDSVSLSDLRKSLGQQDFKDIIVQNFENQLNEFSIRLRSESDAATLRQKMNTVLGTFTGNTFEVLKQDFVGPVIGEQIRRDAIWACIVGLLGIFAYVTLRFDMIFAFGALFSLFHDAIIAVGATIFAGIDVGAATLAAVLTIIGYSVNDTIIVFDRIRENLAIANKSGSVSKKGENASLAKMSIGEIINLSINETLSRTIVTSMTVILVTLALWLFGGGAVSELAFTLLVGVVIGTYSSIFVASPVLVFFERKGKDGNERGTGAKAGNE